MSSVIARITEASAKVPYGDRQIRVDFPGDVLYRIDIPEEHTVTEEGVTVFTRDGIRHLIKELTVVLYLETDEADF